MSKLFWQAIAIFLLPSLLLTPGFCTLSPNSSLVIENFAPLFSEEALTARLPYAHLQIPGQLGIFYLMTHQVSYFKNSSQRKFYVKLTWASAFTVAMGIFLGWHKALEFSPLGFLGMVSQRELRDQKNSPAQIFESTFGEDALALLNLLDLEAQPSNIVTYTFTDARHHSASLNQTIALLSKALGGNWQPRIPHVYRHVVKVNVEGNVIIREFFTKRGSPDEKSIALQHRIYQMLFLYYSMTGKAAHAPKSMLTKMHGAKVLAVPRIKGKSWTQEIYKRNGLAMARALAEALGIWHGLKIAHNDLYREDGAFVPDNFRNDHIFFRWINKKAGVLVASLIDPGFAIRNASLAKLNDEQQEFLDGLISFSKVQHAERIEEIFNAIYRQARAEANAWRLQYYRPMVLQTSA